MPLVWIEQHGRFIPADEPTFRAMPSDAAFAQLKHDRLTKDWVWSVEGRWGKATTREAAEAAANVYNDQRLAARRV
jgi:hypothetical protein